MKKPKRKRTAAEKAARKRGREKSMTIFIGGKKKRVKRPATIEGMDVDEFIRRNDPLWLHQNEMWEVLHELEMAEEVEAPKAPKAPKTSETFETFETSNLPF